MSVKDIETERLWDEMKRKNPSLYDSEHPAPLIEPHAKKREARKAKCILREMAYAEQRGDDYPAGLDFVLLDTEDSDSSTSVHTDEMDDFEEDEWYYDLAEIKEDEIEREKASYYYDYDIDDYVDGSGNKAPWC
jgi:hypothetical protein